LAALFSGLIGLFFLVGSLPDDKLRLVFCNVGQGDAALVYMGYFQALIDVGPSESKLSTCLEGRVPQDGKKIELVFISHSQKDHDGALVWLGTRYQIGKLVKSGNIGDIYRYKNISFEILNQIEPDQENAKDGNEDTMIIRLLGNMTSVLFTGDIGKSEELALLDSGVIEKTDILKVAHHGSKNSSSELFLNKLAPSLAVISVGEKNSYGHPARETLISFDAFKIPIKRTDLDGEIVLEL